VIGSPAGTRDIVLTSLLANLAAPTNQTKEQQMSRIQKAVVAVAAIGALAAGGSAIASAQSGAPASTPAPVTQSATTPEPVGGPDTDTIQSGDQTTPDVVNGKTIAATTAETPGTEQPAASEAPGAPEAPGSETAANSDGPGGHADEPGNPTADHQFQGVE
jgi:hypothetical protein